MHPDYHIEIWQLVIFLFTKPTIQSLFFFGPSIFPFSLDNHDKVSNSFVSLWRKVWQELIVHIFATCNFVVGWFCLSPSCRIDTFVVLLLVFYRPFFIFGQMVKSMDNFFCVWQTLWDGFWEDILLCHFDTLKQIKKDEPLTEDMILVQFQKSKVFCVGTYFSLPFS